MWKKKRWATRNGNRPLTHLAASGKRYFMPDGRNGMWEKYDEMTPADREHELAVRAFFAKRGGGFNPTRHKFDEMGKAEKQIGAARPRKK